MNCVSAEPEANVVHLIVANMGRDGLALCGFTMPGLPPGVGNLHEDMTGQPCRCAPKDTWPRCPACVAGREEVAARGRQRSVS